MVCVDPYLDFGGDRSSTLLASTTSLNSFKLWVRNGLIHKHQGRVHTRELLTLNRRKQKKTKNISPWQPSAPSGLVVILVPQNHQLNFNLLRGHSITNTEE
jgi:hypothetical protein